MNDASLRPEERSRIHGAVDRLLQEQGRYTPVELLIHLGRLPYPRYEAWRCGEPGALEEQLAGNPRRIRGWLEAAAEWAGRLGLVSECHPYTGWGAHAGQDLQCSSDEDERVEALYTTHYRRPVGSDDGQLDLFFDSGETVVLNELRQALLSRRPEAATERLGRLLERNPDHPQRAAAELLCDALASLEGGEPAVRPAAELAAIECHVVPAARELLGASARDLLAPFWRRLAEVLSDRDYDPDADRLHGSWVYAQCLDWEGVRTSVLATPDWDAHWRLLARLAAASRLAGAREEAIAHWCRLCWRFPEQAAGELGDTELPDVALRAAWEDFEQHPGPEGDAAWFPAWLLLVEPGLVHHLAGEAAPDEPGPGRAFRRLHGLLRAVRDGGEEIALRKGLQDESRWLLELYLSRIPTVPA